MSKKQKKMPEIRFAGFEGYWEERKFDSLFDPIPNNTHSRAQLNYDNGKIKNIHYGDILIKYGAVTDCRTEIIPFITDAEVSDYRNLLLQDGDILIADAAEDETVGKATEIRGISDIPVVSGLHTIACRPKVKIQPNYLGYYLNALSYHRQLLPLMQGIKVLSISRTNLAKTTVCYPSTEQEQSQIGLTFAKLDNLIALHQREHSKTVNMKKALLEKMFPKEGETKPEVRFAGFKEPWERRKLGKLADIVRGASPRPIKDPKWFDDESDVGWLRISDVTEQDGRIHYLEQRISEAGQDKTRVLTEPHLLLSIAATVGKPVINYVKTGVHDGFLIFQSPGFNLEFMFQWLEMFRPKWSRYGQPGSQVNLNSDLVKGKKILIPNPEEQARIGELFANLDNLITLQRRELEKLQNMKKALLEKMFV